MHIKKAEAIEKKANLTRQKLHNPNQCNIDIKALVKAYSIHYISKELPGNISGASMITKQGKQFIVVNKYQPETRKKFTTAHEFGHLILGHDTLLNTQAKAVANNKQNKTNNEQLDNPSQILFRNEKTSEGSDWREIEANYFAASLLMPKEILNGEIQKLMQKKFYLSEYDVYTLSNIFGVSTISMSIRLSKLGFM